MPHTNPLLFHVGLITSCVGFGCCLLLGLLAVRIPRLRAHPEVVVLFISACDLLFCLDGIVRAGVWEAASDKSRISEQKSWFSWDDGCSSEGIWAHFWLCCSMTWSFLWALDYTIRQRYPLSSSAVRTRRMHAFTWLFAGISSTILLASGDLTRADDGTCATKTGSWVNLVVVLPLGCCLVTTLYMLFLTTQGEGGMGSSDSRRARAVLISRQRVYCCAFLVSWTFEFSYRLMALFSSHPKPVGVEIAHIALLYLHPVVLVGARTVDRTVRYLWKPPKERPGNDHQVPLLVAVFSDTDLAGMDTRRDTPEDPLGLGDDTDDDVTSITHTHHTASFGALPGVFAPTARQSFKAVELSPGLPPRLSVCVSPVAVDIPRSASFYTSTPRASEGSHSINGDVGVAAPTHVGRTPAPRTRRSITVLPERGLQTEIGMCLLSGILQSIQSDDSVFHGSHAQRVLTRPVSSRLSARRPALSSIYSASDTEDDGGVQGIVSPTAATAIRRTASMRVPSVASPHDREPAVPTSPAGSTPLSFDSASRTETLHLHVVANTGADDGATARSFEFSTLFPIGFSCVRQQPRPMCVGTPDPNQLCEAAVRELAPVGLLDDRLSMVVSAAGSNSFFIQSHNFVVKTVCEPEVESLLRMLPRYIQHVTQACPHTLLGRILGCYAVKLSSSARVYAVLLENVLRFEPVGGRVARCLRQPARVFDLKGSTVDRHAGADARVLKDTDFRGMFPAGLAVTDAPAALQALLATLGEDVGFLKREGIMDYSLLVADFTPPDVAVDTDARHIVAVGIVDYLQRYDVKKRMERGLKTFMHASLDVDISAVGPDAYAQRFLKLVNSEAFHACQEP